MSRRSIAVLALATSALVASGCGESKTSSTAKSTTVAQTQTTTTPGPVTATTGPLSRSELIAKADLICGRLNAKRASITISRRSDIQNLMGPLATYELTAASAMRKLTPPASMAADWKLIVDGSQRRAEIIKQYVEVFAHNRPEHGAALDAKLTKAKEQVKAAATRQGFKDCANEA